MKQNAIVGVRAYSPMTVSNQRVELTLRERAMMIYTEGKLLAHLNLRGPCPIKTGTTELRSFKFLIGNPPKCIRMHGHLKDNLGPLPSSEATSFQTKP